MDTKTRPLYILSTRNPPQNRDTYRLKVKGWKKIFHANRDQKKAGVAILISDKIDFKTKTEKRQRRTLHNDQRIDLRRRYNNYKYICTHNSSTSIHKTKLMDIKREIDSNAIIVGGFNTPLTPMDRSSKQKI